MEKNIEKHIYCYYEQCSIIDELFDKYCVLYRKWCGEDVKSGFPRDFFTFHFSEDTFTMKSEDYTIKIKKDGTINISTEPNCCIDNCGIQFLLRLDEISDEIIDCLEEIL